MDSQFSEKTSISITKDLRGLIRAAAHLTGLSLEQVVVRSVIKYAKELSSQSATTYEKLHMPISRINQEVKTRYSGLTSTRSQRMKRLNAQRRRSTQSPSTIVNLRPL